MACLVRADFWRRDTLIWLGGPKSTGRGVVGGTRTPGTWELYYRFREKYLKRCRESVVECV